MVSTTNFIISISIIIVLIIVHASSTSLFLLFILWFLIYYNSFHHINFYFNVHNFIFHLISFLSQLILITAYFFYFFRLIDRRANKSLGQVQRSHSIPLVFKFYVLILICFRATFMEKIFFWIYLFGFTFCNFLIFLLFG